MNQTWCAQGLKLLLQLALLFVAVVFFGLPSWKTYQAGEVLLVKRERKQERLPAPAVTICPGNPFTDTGFPRNVSIDKGSILEGLCKNVTDVAQCLESESYILKNHVNVTMGFSDTQSLMNTDFWTSDISFMTYGRCHTLQSPFTMSVMYTTDALRIQLDDKIKYYIFVHDINYFVINVNPFAIPLDTLSIEKEHGSAYYKMYTVRRTNIRDCNPDPSYKFSSCIKRSLSSRLGCRLPWDTASGDRVPLCTTVQQYR